MSTSSSEDIDSPSGEDFRQNEWIGVGRILPIRPNDIPIGLANFFAMLLDVPATVKTTHYPSTGLNIDRFLAFPLPKETHSLPKIPVDEWFSHVVPNEHEELFVTRPLPAWNFLDKLYDRFCQAVLDGAKSIVDPAFPWSYLPLWCIQFWKDMYTIYGARREWKEAVEWLDENGINSTGNKRELFIHVRQTLGTLRWNEETTIPGANQTTTLAFASYLSYETMMSTIHIDMMFAYLSELVGDSERGGTHVETMRFWFEIDKLKSQADLEKQSKHFMRHIEQRINDGEIKILIMPCFLKREHHWLTIKIDFVDQTLSYGKYSC